MTAQEPRIAVDVAGCRPGSSPGGWEVTWRICNLGEAPLEVETAWVPHGRFRGEGRLTLTPPHELGSGQSLKLALSVQAREAPGMVVENAFLILRVSLADTAWRVFTRMRVEFDAQSAPRPIPEVVTTQVIQSDGGAD